jgi:hypothetical protein
MFNSSNELVEDYVYRTMSRKEYNENRGELVNINGRTHASD